MDTEEAIQRVLAGEDRFFEGLIERHAGLVWAICSSYAPLRADREDLAQETFIQCYLHLHTLRSGAAFGAWLSQLARRTCLDWLRKIARRRQAIAQHEDLLMGAHTPEDASQTAARRDLHAYLHEEVRKLPPKTREAMFLHYTEGLSVAEAAEQLGVSENTVSKRLAYGRQLITERVGNEFRQAMASERHSKNLASSAMALIPFGTAPWAGLAGTTVTSALTSKATVLWGTTIMTKNAVAGLVAVLVVAGALFAMYTWQPSPSQDLALDQGASDSTSPSTTASPPVYATQDSALGAAGPRDVGDKPAPPDASAAVPDSSSETPAPVESASVSGTVRDTEHSPVNGALVQLEFRSASPARYETTTDAAGQYEITGVVVEDKERVFGYASAEGYVMQRNGFDVSPGAQVNKQDFTLEPARFFVAGRVVSSLHRPIEDARVGTMHYGYGEDGIAQMQESGGRDGRGDISSYDFVFALTDATGAFVMAVPHEGYCDIFTTAEGYGSAYYPAVPTGTEDALFTLPAGGGISGRVTDANDDPVRNKEVEVQGHAFPGGLDFGVQELPLRAKTVLTDENGQYLADMLGEDFVYTVSVRNAAPEKAVLPAELGVAAIGEVLSSLNEMLSGSESFAAQRTGIRVRSGMVTSGIDLKLIGDMTATVQGTVTDRGSGAPVAAVAVMAVSVDERVDTLSATQKFRADRGGSAVSLPDGSYSITLQGLEQKTLFAITYEYFTEGGSAWEVVPDVVEIVELGPGDRAEVNLRLDAPVTVPVRYVNASGAPVEGVLAAMRQAGAGGGCGGTLISNAEGRVEFHGIKPDVLLEALAWRDTNSALAVLGASEPFQGKPGERVAEVVVECHEMGGVQGLVLDESGAPLAYAEVGIGADSPSQGGAAIGCVTGADGRFLVPEAFVEGDYPVLYIGRQNGDRVEVGMVQEVEIAPGMVTDLGAITLQPYTPEAAEKLLR